MKSVAERKSLLDGVFVSFVNEGAAPQTAAALGAFGLAEMPAARLAAQDLASRCDLKALGNRLLRFDTFGTSHKFNSSC